MAACVIQDQGESHGGKTVGRRGVGAGAEVQIRILPPEDGRFTTFPNLDAGPRPSVDAGPADAGLGDAGPRPRTDGGPADAGPRPSVDAGPADAGFGDAGPRPGVDGGPEDAGLGDAGPRPRADAGPADAGLGDAGVTPRYLCDGLLRPVHLVQDVGVPAPAFDFIYSFQDGFVYLTNPYNNYAYYINLTLETIVIGGTVSRVYWRGTEEYRVVVEEIRDLLNRARPQLSEENAAYVDEFWECTNVLLGRDGG